MRLPVERISRTGSSEVAKRYPLTDKKRRTGFDKFSSEHVDFVQDLSARGIINETAFAARYSEAMFYAYARSDLISKFIAIPNLVSE